MRESLFVSFYRSEKIGSEKLNNLIPGDLVNK